MQVAGNDLGAALRSAIAGGYVAEMSGQTYTVTAPIVINVTSTIQGPLGIDLGGATIVSQIPNGQPVIQINAGPGVDLRYLTLANFTIQGNGLEGDGIRIVADGNDRWIYNFTIENVNVRNVGGYGLNVQGSVFEGLISNSWMTGNGEGGAYFGHSAGGGQASALRWFGGGLEGNDGAGLVLGAGTRDMSVDGVSFASNNGLGISAEYGITSVADSQFRDNLGVGIWFQNYGNFTNNTFSSSGVQATGIVGYLAGGATLIGNSSVYTGAGSNTTVLANLQGHGDLYMTDDTGEVVTGSSVSVSGLGGGNVADVSVTSEDFVLPELEAITAATTAPVADSIGTGALETALRTALTGGIVGALSGVSFTVTTSIVINLAGSSQGPLGIDLGGAKILSQITNGAPVIQIIAGPGIDVSALTLSNFMIHGNGLEGDGIKIVADGTDRSVSLKMSNVNVEHVGGIGLDVIGNVSGTVSNSWMHGNVLGGARFANSAGGGTADGLEWLGGGFRKNGVAGLILDNGAHDMRVQGAYFVENQGAGILATSGITRVEQSGFENNRGAGALVGGSSTFLVDTFSTYGPQTVGVGGYLTGDTVIMIGDGNEYYGGGTDPTALANLHGTGTLSIAGGGKVIAGPDISITGGSAFDSTPVTASLSNDTGASSSDRLTSDPALTGTGDANAVVHFTVDGQAIASTVTADAGGDWSFTPSGLADGQHTIVASETNAAGATSSASLTFALDRTAPEGAITGIATASGQATLTGTSGSAGDQISIYDGMTWLGFATTGSNGAWSFTAAAAADVAHNYGINLTDLAGNNGTGGGRGLLGHTGADSLTGSAGNDVIVGGAGNDSLSGGNGNDTISGGTGADNLNGGNGADLLIGGVGADVVDVGTSNDNMQDIVRFTDSNEFGDSVSDFDVTGTSAQRDKVQIAGTLNAAYDDITDNDVFVWTTGNGSNGGNTTANLNTSTEALFLSGTNGEGVSNRSLGNASTVAAEFNAEFSIVANAGQDALLVVNDTNANSFALWQYVEDGTSPEIQAAELSLIGVFTANGAVSTSEMLLI